VTAIESYGFDSNEKLLIIHADDVGMCHSVNRATFEAFHRGILSSCSLMIPCPWIMEAVEFFKENTHYDYGIHSTLTSEWKFYRWGPITPKEKVPTLIDDQGYLWSNASEAAKARVEEVETELRAQVKRSLSFGLRPSHLDTHMGVIYRRPDFLRAYIKVAIDYNLKPMLVKLSSEIAREAIREMKVKIPKGLILEMEKLGVPLLDELYTKIPGLSLQEKVKGFRSILTKLRAGTITQVIVHLGFDNEELKAIIRGKHYIERYLDYKLITSPEALKLIEEFNVTLISWRDLK